MKIGHTRSGASLMVSVVYRPPGGDNLEKFFSVLQEASVSMDNIIVMDDINAHLERSNN